MLTNKQVLNNLTKIHKETKDKYHKDLSREEILELRLERELKEAEYLSRVLLEDKVLFGKKELRNLLARATLEAVVMMNELRKIKSSQAINDNEIK